LTAEATPWDLSLYNTTGVKVYDCSGYLLLGGYNILGGSGITGPTPYYGQYFKRTYIPPVAHNQINIQMRVYTIDSWDGNTNDDHFEIGIDGANTYAWRMNGFDPTYANTNICGNLSFKDFSPFTVYMSYPHTSMTSLELKIINGLDQFSSDESIGFRDIKIEFVTNPAPYFSLCGVGTAPLSSSPCPCASPNMFMYPPNSGTCVSCDSTCATCSGPASTDCTSCSAGNYLSSGQCLPCTGNCETCSGTASTCTSCHTGWFLVGSSCYSTCDSPLISYTSNGVTYCKTPCPGQYAYWDGNCGPTCSYNSNAAGTFAIYPTTVNTFSICNYPCSSTSQVLYWNGTCSASGCPLPLSMTLFHGSTFCDFPCGNGQYLYWNGTCSNTCPSPLSDDTQGTNLPQKFCWYTCQPNEYLYWDQTCHNSCESPLWPETQGTSLQRQFCWFPCKPNEYLYWNGTCLAQCDYPLSKKLFAGHRFCNYPCEPSHYLFTNGSCLASCPVSFWQNDEYRFCDACQDPLCASCDFSFGTKCEVCKEQSILDSDSVCKNCQALSSEYIEQNDETYEYQYKLRLWPASCDLDGNTLKQYLFPTQESKALFPHFGLQILTESQDSLGKYFMIKLNFTGPLLEENNLSFTLSYLSTALKVPKTPKKAPTAPPSLKTIVTVVNAGTLLSGLYLGSAAAFWSLISFQQFIGYFAYMNIIYPRHLETFFLIFVSTNLEFFPNPLESLMKRLSTAYASVVDEKQQYQLPHKFTELDTPTLFLINAGSTFFICILFFAVLLILGLLLKSKRLQSLKFLQGLYQDFKWNAIIRIFLESGIPLAFAIFIQIRKISFENVPYGLSVSCAIIAMIYTLSMLYSISQILIDLNNEKMKDQKVKKSIGTLYEGLVLKKDQPLGKCYYVLILLRGILLVFVDVFLDEIPAAQIIIMTFFNVFLMVYVCQRIEFEARYLTWTNQIAEVFILIGEILIITLSPEGMTDEFRDLIGWIIIALFSMILALQFVYGIYLQTLALVGLVKKGRNLLKKKSQQKVSPDTSENTPIATSRNIIIAEISAGNMTINENCTRGITLES